MTTKRYRVKLTAEEREELKVLTTKRVGYQPGSSRMRVFCCSAMSVGRTARPDICFSNQGFTLAVPSQCSRMPTAVQPRAVLVAKLSGTTARRLKRFHRVATRYNKLAISNSPYNFNLDLVSVFPCFGTGNRRFQAFHTAFRRALRRGPGTDTASIIAKPNPESPD